jgi:hypothetical protein
MLGRAEAGALGIPALPLAIFQHPLGGLKPEIVEKRAQSVVDTIQQMLVTPREQLMAAANEL